MILRMRLMWYAASGEDPEATAVADAAAGESALRAVTFRSAGTVVASAGTHGMLRDATLPSQEPPTKDGEHASMLSANCQRSVLFARLRPEAPLCTACEPVAPLGGVRLKAHASFWAASISCSAVWRACDMMLFDSLWAPASICVIPLNAR
jgi:hypothetical protein